MKTGELMIGDWVYSSFSSHPCKITHIGLFGDEYIEVGVTCVLGLKDIASLTPIPLTQEILEKNDFFLGYTSNEEDAISQIGVECQEGYVYEEGCGSVKVIFPNESDGGVIELSDQNFDRNMEFYFVKTMYVHELQHALKLCGIDKEIVL